MEKSITELLYGPVIENGTTITPSLGHSPITNSDFYLSYKLYGSSQERRLSFVGGTSKSTSNSYGTSFAYDGDKTFEITHNGTVTNEYPREITAVYNIDLTLYGILEDKSLVPINTILPITVSSNPAPETGEPNTIYIQII